MIAVSRTRVAERCRALRLERLQLRHCRLDSLSQSRPVKDAAERRQERLRAGRGGLGLGLRGVGLLLQVVGRALGLRCRLLGLVELLGRLLRRLTRILLRRSELRAQIVVGALRSGDDVGAGVLGLVDLLLLGGDPGVRVVEVRVEAGGVDRKADDGGGEETGDGDPAPRSFVGAGGCGSESVGGCGADMGAP